MQLSLNPDTCILCTKCVKVCPSRIFTQANAKAPIELCLPESCIVCGHCVAVCPTQSITHSEFPPQKIHAIETSILPTPEQVLLLCKARRSIRSFAQTPIPMVLLDQILEAAHRAPTAMNLQQVAFTLVVNPKKLQQITEITLDTFSSIVKKIMNPLVKPILKLSMPEVYTFVPAFERLLSAYEKGNDLILRKATAVLLIHTPESSRFGRQDANLAYQNA
ncbi:MAG: nitroreductase family protein, partial [Bacteroidales bacterium]